MRATVRALALGALLGCLPGLAVTACGLPEGTVEQVDAESVPGELLDPTPPEASLGKALPPPAGAPHVAFVDNEQQLVTRDRVIATDGPTAEVLQELLDELAEGPDDDERAEGLGSALAPGTSFEVLSVEDGLARLGVPAPVGDIAADRAALAAGQVVLTSATVRGVDRVRLVFDGETLPAPLPGGLLTRSPLVPAQYASLVDESAAATSSNGTPPG